MISSDFFEMLVVFSAIVLVVKLISDHLTRSKLIRQGMVDEKIKYLYFSRYKAGNHLNSVKWGLVLVGIGLALFLQQFLNFSDEAMLGLMFLFAGIAFLVYYALAKNDITEKEIQ